MTQTNRPLDWTVEDARRARSSVDLAQGPLRRAISPMFAQGINAKNRLAAGFIGHKGYDAQLGKVAAHMNRNRDAFLHYAPREGDVVVSAYFKAGTNWIMHVCHQICHLGAADFDHIQDVIPWPDAAEPRFWVNVHDDAVRQTPTGLRVIKSHLPGSKIPLNAGAKYIAVTRDPKDCAASAYHFFRALVFGATMPPPDVWLAHFRSEHPNFGRWDVFTDEWYRECQNPNVLFLCFEDVKHDSIGAIVQIAQFLNVTLSDEQLEKVAKLTTVDAMKAINHKFYPARQNRFTDPKGKIIRKGGIGDASSLFAQQDLEAFDTHWKNALAARNSAFPYMGRYCPHQSQTRPA
jgi:hypothetical protein